MGAEGRYVVEEHGRLERLELPERLEKLAR